MFIVKYTRRNKKLFEEKKILTYKIDKKYDFCNFSGKYIFELIFRVQYKLIIFQVKQQ